MSDRNYDEALTKLLPPGPAWSRMTGSPGSAVLTAGANALSRIDALAERLLEEADPRTCMETFPDWLRVYGLPDECLEGLKDLSDERLRQALLLLIRRCGLTESFYKQLGAIFDIDIDVGSYDPFTTRSRVNDRLYGPQWGHAYVLVVRTNLETEKILFRTTSRVNERLASWGISFIECLVRKNSPAHAEVVFEYEVKNGNAG